MYHQRMYHAWRSDEQLIDDSLKRAFGKPPKIDKKFQDLLDKLEQSSGRQDGEENKET